MKNLIYIVILLSLNTVLICPSIVFAGGGHDHGHHEEHEPIKGPNGGRLIEDGNLALEVTIFERGVPPQFRLFAYDSGVLIKPELVEVKIELKRFADVVENFEFHPESNYLTSAQVVEEPHSFDVSIDLKYKERSYKFEYQSYEGRTEFTAEAIKQNKIEITKAEPRLIKETVDVYGKLIPNEDKVAHIAARFPGIIKEVKKKLGDSVEKGEVIAVVESNQNLIPYEVRSQISGMVVERHASLGEFVSDSREIFVIADLSSLWAEFQIYRNDFGRAANNQEIEIDLGEENKKIKSQISYISPLTDEATQSKKVRALILNNDLQLRPGLFVTGKLVLAKKEVPIAVKRNALQTFRDWNVIYLNQGNSFQAMPVELGQKDSEYVEIISGLVAGQKYVSENSFIIKADIEKSGASHDH